MLARKLRSLGSGSAIGLWAKTAAWWCQHWADARAFSRACYAGFHGNDAANNDRLIAELAPLPDDARSAYYVCTVALADPQGEVKAVAEGRCHGVITRELRGEGGFGYDPLFFIPEYHRTFGELSARVKHAISHRARALSKLAPALRHHLSR